MPHVAPVCTEVWGPLCNPDGDADTPPAGRGTAEDGLSTLHPLGVFAQVVAGLWVWRLISRLSPPRGDSGRHAVAPSPLEAAPETHSSPAGTRGARVHRCAHLHVYVW